jgi:outer membrane protein OmpA-like peptidoglycan-associated protein
MQCKTSFLIGLVALASACSASLPPAELVDAQAAYKKAAAGPAAQLDPAQLHVAEEQLALAEKTFDSDGDTFKTRDRAYVAERKSELADVLARTTMANQETNLAAQQVQLTQAKDLQTARTQLVQTREQLAAATAAMAQLAALKTVKNVKEEDRGLVITLSGSVLFASGKYELLSSAQETLGNVTTALEKGDPNRRIVVQGYTDSQGPEGYNMTLSQNRAETVRAYLTSHGIPPERVTAQGFGPASPVADNASPEGRANNRRVEIVVQPAVMAATPTPSSQTTSTTTTAVVH